MSDPHVHHAHDMHAGPSVATFRLVLALASADAPDARLGRMLQRALEMDGASPRARYRADAWCGWAVADPQHALALAQATRLPPTATECSAPGTETECRVFVPAAGTARGRPFRPARMSESDRKSAGGALTGEWWSIAPWRPVTSRRRAHEELGPAATGICTPQRIAPCLARSHTSPTGRLGRLGRLPVTAALVGVRDLTGRQHPERLAPLPADRLARAPRPEIDPVKPTVVVVPGADITEIADALGCTRRSPARGATTS